MDTFIHYGMAAGIQAMKDAGIEVTDANCRTHRRHRRIRYRRVAAD